MLLIKMLNLDAIQSHGRQRRIAKATNLGFFIQTFPTSATSEKNVSNVSCILDFGVHLRVVEVVF